MRGAAFLLLLAVGAAADPFAPKREELQLDDAAYARYVETLTLLKEMLPRDPAVALDRAATLLEPYGLDSQLEDRVGAALVTVVEEGPRRGLLLSLAGHLTVAKANETGNVWVFGPNGVVQQGGIDDATRKLVKAAVEMLREAIRLLPKDARAREDLATALGLLDGNGNKEEIARLQTEAGVLRMVKLERPPLPLLEIDAARLRQQAEELEQKAAEPDHAAALLLRKQALVYDFCAQTIPIEYDPALYGPLSLLASEDLVVRNLTRTYKKRDGTVDSVPPSYHAARPSQRVQIVEGLGHDPGPAAGAALLKVLATAVERDAVSDAALRALVTGKHEAVRRGLPAILASAVYAQGPQQRIRQGGFVIITTGVGPEAGFSPLGERLLVEAAVALKVADAVPALVTLLPIDDDLVEPRGIAAAIGELGGPAQADALLLIARDPDRDVFFRREAILALGRVAPARLGEVPAEPPLELALAAARYRAEPSEALRGRLLQGLGQPHEADDAARYLADLNVREAIPDLERFLADKPDDYAAPLVKAAHDRLVGRP